MQRASRALKRAVDPSYKGLHASHSWCACPTHNLLCPPPPPPPSMKILDPPLRSTILNSSSDLSLFSWITITIDDDCEVTEGSIPCSILGNVNHTVYPSLDSTVGAGSSDLDSMYLCSRIIRCSDGRPIYYCVRWHWVRGKCHGAVAYVKWRLLSIWKSFREKIIWREK